MADVQTPSAPQNNLPEIFGFPEGHLLASDLDWFHRNPDRVLRLSVHHTEFGNRAYPGGPDRPDVAGMDLNAKVFLIARAKAGHKPDGSPDAIVPIVHEVSTAALTAFRFGDYGDDLNEFSGDSVGLSLLEIEVQLGNPSAVNMRRLMVVPSTAKVPELWQGWIGPEPTDPDPFDFPDADA